MLGVKILHLIKVIEYVFCIRPGGQLSRGATAIRAGHALAKAVEPGLANPTFIFATVFCDPLSTLSDRDTDLQAVG